MAYDDSFKYTHVGLYLGVKIGYTKTGKPTKFHDWVIVSEDPDNFNFRVVDKSYLSGDRKTISFSPKNIFSASPGSMYKLSLDEGGWYKKGYFVGRLTVKDLLARIQARHHTNSYALAEESKRMKDLSKNEVFRLLEPLRKLYKDSSARKRTILLAYIIRRITS